MVFGLELSQGVEDQCCGNRPDSRATSCGERYQVYGIIFVMLVVKEAQASVLPDMYQ